MIFVLWFLWALSGWVAVYRHNKKHPGIFWPGLCVFATFFGPIMFAESDFAEKRQKWHRGEMSDKEYFSS